ncbi:MAG: fructose-1,6-bisphosphatase II / sedoheptulose-1,7-bisphosphatase, partial [Pelagibacterales bacterium]|nr:fructose-1,6-bisphosphatase II / sedoheptulose-1,7-bisphosphatase [Pelagibacterales bacterium]
AAYGASLYKGKNDKIAADKAAVDEMRKELNLINMKGKIVIGEGELDEAPMLYVNEKVGTQNGEEFDIAVDPLEGTNFTAQNLPNALSVMAIARKGNILNAPDTYMDKIAVGPGLPDDLINLDFNIKKNIQLLSDAKNTSPNKLSACVLDRPRHQSIISDLKSLGVKINYITDGDVSGIISVAQINSLNDIYIGTGGGPEGVLAAAALSCLGGQMQTRLIYQNESEREKTKNMGILDLNKKYNILDMVSGDVIFCASGVTDGDIVKGIKDLGDSFESETYVLHKSSKTNELIKNIIKK